MAKKHEVLVDEPEQQRKLFYSSVGRFKKKVNQMEAILYSEPFSDDRQDTKDAWRQKLNAILLDDCGLSTLEKSLAKTRNHGKAETKTEGGEEELTAEQIAGSRKKKKKKELKSEDFLKKRAFGSKPEYEALRVVQNYNGANTVYRGTRVLRRLGPQGQTPLAQTGVPPWIGPCYYPNRTADKLYTHVVPYHSAFKATEREKKTIHDIRKEISVHKEWSGLSKVHEELGLTSTPYSSPPGSPSRSRNMNQSSADDLLGSNMWSRSSVASTLGAKNMTNHFVSPPTPILGSRTVQKAIYMAKQKKKGVIDQDDDSSTSSIIARPYDIERTRIFDENVLSSSLAGDGSSYFPDDGSTASMSHGPDTISLLSKSLNFKDFTAFSVDSVMSKAVKHHQMKRPLPDYTLGALSLYDEKTTDTLHFSTELPPLKKHGAHRSNDSSELTDTRDHVSDATETRGDVSTAGSEAGDLIETLMMEKQGPLNRRRRSVMNAINLNPMAVNTSKAIVDSAHSAAKIAVASEKQSGGQVPQAPVATTKFRRNALRPIPLETPDVVGLLLRGKSQTIQVDTGDHENLSLELSKKTTMLSRSKSGFEMTLCGPGSSSFSEKRRTTKDEGDTIKKFTSRSLSNMSFSEMKVLMTGDASIDLNGLLLPGPPVDADGSASLYEPPETPRLQKNGLNGQNRRGNEYSDEEDDFFD